VPALSKSSLDKLSTCDPRIQEVILEAIKYYDFTVLVGHRTKEDQDKAVAEKKSTKAWPNSKHNSLPSRAIDIAPYPIDWSDLPRFALLVGFIIGLAKARGINLRSGLDWDDDGVIKEHTLIDGPHIELID
jgi:peptidoglycan LD-endopeptidase CwlK